jgi:hypothetical protein
LPSSPIPLLDVFFAIFCLVIQSLRNFLLATFALLRKVFAKSHCLSVRSYDAVTASLNGSSRNVMYFSFTEILQLSSIPFQQISRQ